MNILFVINSLNYGGAERYVSVLSHALVEQGDKVVIISTGGALVEQLNKKVSHRKVDSIPDSSRDGLIKTARSIEIICKSNQIDLVNCNSVTAFRAANLARRLIQAPVIYTAHAVEQSKLPVIGAELDKSVDKVIAVSNFIKHHLIKTGLISSKINLIYHGVDTNKFKERSVDSSIKTSLGIKSDEGVVMCVARLESEKGIDRLIMSVPVVRSRGNHIKIVIVGGGSRRKEYEKLSNLLGVKDAVLFLGSREDVADLLGIADVFCLPSINEALSFAILEAMAEGKPVVATKVGGIPEVVVDQVTGLLVPPGDIRGLAKSINLLLENKPLAKQLGASAKKRIEDRFRFDRMLEQTFSIYEEVLEEQKVFA